MQTLLAPPLQPRTLPLDLDAFEGPFDLLCTLVLKEELDLADVDVLDVVLAFVGQLAERERIDLEACGEFLVLVAALLELKGRELFGEESTDDEVEELVELVDPDVAAAELAERLAQYRRFKAASGWLDERLEEQAARFFRLGPAPLAPKPERKIAPQDPAALAAALRGLATEPPVPSLAHLAMRLPPLPAFVERFRALVRARRRFVFDEEVAGLSRLEEAVALLAILELVKYDEVKVGQEGFCRPIVVWNGPHAPR
ncbi:MAG: segregation/condensation protein A [Thermoleophilia bacterium]